MFGMKFFTGLYLGGLMLCPFFLLLSTLLPQSQEYVTHVFPLSSTNLPVFCICGHWRATGPQLKPRDKNIIAVSAGGKRIKSLQIGPFRILMRRMCEAHAVFSLCDGEGFCEVIGQGLRLRFWLCISTALL